MARDGDREQAAANGMIEGQTQPDVDFEPAIAGGRAARRVVKHVGEQLRERARLRPFGRRRKIETLEGHRRLDLRDRGPRGASAIVRDPLSFVAETVRGLC
jgi:hypothetical protein